MDLQHCQVNGMGWDGLGCGDDQNRANIIDVHVVVESKISLMSGLDKP